MYAIRSYYAEREYLTQPFTNYNLLSFDKSLKNNSYVSLINTNVSRFNDNYSANVTGTEFMLNNKSKTYSISGKGVLSQIHQKDVDAEYGYTTYLRFAKTSGQFRYSLSNLIESDTYNPNDFGYLQNNNEISNTLSFSYNFYKPFGHFLKLYNYLNFWQHRITSYNVCYTKLLRAISSSLFNFLGFSCFSCLEVFSFVIN